MPSPNYTKDTDPGAVWKNMGDPGTWEQEGGTFYNVHGHGGGGHGGGHGHGGGAHGAGGGWSSFGYPWPDDPEYEWWREHPVPARTVGDAGMSSLVVLVLIAAAVLYADKRVPR